MRTGGLPASGPGIRIGRYVIPNWPAVNSESGRAPLMPPSFAGARIRSAGSWSIARRHRRIDGADPQLSPGVVMREFVRWSAPRVMFACVAGLALATAWALGSWLEAHDARYIASLPTLFVFPIAGQAYRKRFAGHRWRLAVFCAMIAATAVGWLIEVWAWAWWLGPLHRPRIHPVTFVVASLLGGTCSVVAVSLWAMATDARRQRTLAPSDRSRRGIAVQ
jgi:hypothetical protein